LAPVLTSWDERMLNTLLRAAERYIRIAFGRLDPDPNEHLRRQAAHEYLVEQFRLRDPAAAAEATREHLAHNEELARSALTGPAGAPRASAAGRTTDKRGRPRDVSAPGRVVTG
jgi:hypothetical protein